MSESSKTLYERMDGAKGVQKMVEGFYHTMHELEGAQRLKELHQANLEETKEKLIMYFTGRFGGPPHYVDRFGHPRLRARHKHVPIGALERDQWLLCMEKSLQSMELDQELYRDIMEKISPMADHMRNVEGDGDPSDKCP